MTLTELLAEEKKHRLAGKWLMYSGPVVNDSGREVHVGIKSYGMYNQIFRIGGIDYASGHTINKVGAMHEHIRSTINAK